MSASAPAGETSEGPLKSYRKITMRLLIRYRTNLEVRIRGHGFNSGSSGSILHKDTGNGKKASVCTAPQGPKGNCEGVNTGDVYFRKK